MKINELDTVELKDGTVGTIVNINAPGESYELDIGTSPEDWETVTIKHDRIKRVISHA
ncbi:hypothetical protein ACPBEH_11285 [Latilactobacillus sp. 5-91]|uniref:hypothetical protein n=1 Tax=Latilactobacillus sp. 5-91 TaxID=3410924 RepID=UPI003C77285B